jgi:hypothetical protein
MVACRVARNNRQRQTRKAVRSDGFIEQQIDRGMGAACGVMKTILAPWGGPEVYIDAYENSIRAATELQMTIARTLELEPARSLAATYADLTRDIGATQVSSARWIVDV